MTVKAGGGILAGRIISGSWNDGHRKERVMKLSQNDIENCAITALNSFMSAIPNKVEWVKPILIDNFAIYTLGLSLDYTRLCDDGKMLGITTYCDTKIELYRYLRKETISVPKNMLLINESLKPPSLLGGQPDSERTRRRFTIAHECAHQILYRMIPDEKRREYDLRYSARVISIQEYKNMEDWLEWQSNILAAALLMPKKYIELLLGNRRVTIYGKRLNRPDGLLVANMSNRLAVSRTALLLRLRQLEYAKALPAEAYFDPTDIERDDEIYAVAEIGGGVCA